MMKRVIWIIVVLLVGAYFLNNYLENKAKKELKKANAEIIMEARKAAVVELIKRTNAVDNWEQDLRRKGALYSYTIQTIDLERLWLLGRPILFLGEIRDVATSDQKNYRIVIDGNNILLPKLRLILKCKKPLVDLFLDDHPDLFKNYNVNNSVAVIANIDKIKTEFGSGEAAEKILIGKGKCIDIVYADRVYDDWY